MKNKGIDELLLTAKAIKNKYSDVEFHILGNCEEAYEDILRNCQKEGIVTWHGSVPDIRSYMEHSYATIHPSYHEGMANVLLETCAAGRPVITTNINGCKEAVEDGVTGYLCKVKDTNDLLLKVDKFIQLSYEEKRTMGLNARKRMEKVFDRNIVIEAYMHEIEKFR